VLKNHCVRSLRTLCWRIIVSMILQQQLKYIHWKTNPPLISKLHELGEWCNYNELNEWLKITNSMSDLNTTKSTSHLNITLSESSKNQTCHFSIWISRIPVKTRMICFLRKISWYIFPKPLKRNNKNNRRLRQDYCFSCGVCVAECVIVCRCAATCVASGFVASFVLVTRREEWVCCDLLQLVSHCCSIIRPIRERHNDREVDLFGKIGLSSFLM